VQAYVVDQVRDKMIGGEAAMAMIYSGELLYVQECLEEAGSPYVLKYVIPKEGSNVWIDSWVIPKNARHKENAEKWMNFLCRADIAKENFEYITYPTPEPGGICSSSSCFCVTSPGAPIMTSWAFLFIGKGMISRMESSPASSMTMRSTPGAMPAWGARRSRRRCTWRGTWLSRRPRPDAPARRP
jgi:hypothetical protein